MEAARRRQLRQTQEEVDVLARQHRHADPEYRRLRVELEAKLEEALRRRDELGRGLTSDAGKTVASLTNEEAAELVARTAALEDLWKAPTTTNEDRKYLLGSVISRVVVHASTNETVNIEIGVSQVC